MGGSTKKRAGSAPTKLPFLEATRKASPGMQLRSLASSLILGSLPSFSVLPLAPEVRV